MVEDFIFFTFLDMAAIDAYIINSEISPGITHTIFRRIFSEEFLEKSELQLSPTPSPGRPPQSSVRAPHCPVPLIWQKELQALYNTS